jgi:hypothetical protein
LLDPHSPDLQVTLHELGQQIGSDRVNVTIGAETPAARPYTRTYTSLSDIAREVDLSRILAGVVSDQPICVVMEGLVMSM